MPVRDVEILVRPGLEPVVVVGLMPVAVVLQDRMEMRGVLVVLDGGVQVRPAAEPPRDRRPEHPRVHVDRGHMRVLHMRHERCPTPRRSGRPSAPPCSCATTWPPPRGRRAGHRRSRRSRPPSRTRARRASRSSGRRPRPIRPRSCGGFLTPRTGPRAHRRPARPPAPRRPRRCRRAGCGTRSKPGICGRRICPSSGDSLGLSRHRLSTTYAGKGPRGQSSPPVVSPVAQTVGVFGDGFPPDFA
jgi:hypothetical protein